MLAVIAMQSVHSIFPACIVVVLLFAVGCGPSPAERDLKRQVESISQAYHAADIEAELRLVYSLLQKDGAHDIHTNAVPPKICSLPIFAGVSNELSFMVIGGAQPALMVWHDGGPVHQGIVYCPFDGGESVARLIHDGNVILVPWTNGIFFYDFCL
jgi:hypothetical protein